jgi:vacuolar iron transporter family protein
MDECEDKNLKDHGDPAAYSWVSDFVYGGIDGTVTTFAVVAGVEGASLALPIILILGFANLFADGFSMAVGKYSSDRASLERYEKIRKVELAHIEESPECEKKEVGKIMANYGFEGKDLARATEIITSSPRTWVDIMMRNEFNLTRENINPLKGASVTFVSFVVMGFIPLAVYTLNSKFHVLDEHLFFMASFATLITLFVVGAIRSRFTLRHWFFSGLEVAFVGGVAAAIAYLVGFLLKGLVVLI